MLESLGVDPVAEWVLHHHERWDGTGYPERLGGEEIARRPHHLRRGRLRRDDLGSRIPRPADAARGDRGSSAARLQFDPEIVAAFARELVDRTPALAAAAG